MIHKPQSKSKMRDAAFIKENRRLQRKIFTQEAQIMTLRNELLLRPPFSQQFSKHKLKSKSLSIKVLNDWAKALPKSTEKGKDAA
jgi:hypothetical protein